MSQNYKVLVDKIKREGFEFEFSKYLSEGFKLGFKNAGWFTLFIVCAAIISFVIGLLTTFIPFNDYIVELVVSPGLYAGIVLFYAASFKGEIPNFALFFSGFVNNFGHLILSKILYSILSVLVLLPAGFLLSEYVDFGEFIDMFRGKNVQALQGFFLELVEDVWLLFALGSYLFFTQVILMILFLYSTNFIVQGRMNALEGLSASFHLVKKRLLYFFGLFFVLALASMALLLFTFLGVFGIILIFLGMIILMSIYVAVINAVFHNVIESKLDEDIKIQTEDILDA